MAAVNQLVLRAKPSHLFTRPLKKANPPMSSNSHPSATANRTLAQVVGWGLVTESERIRGIKFHPCFMNSPREVSHDGGGVLGA